jgi:hypothetical protein
MITALAGIKGSTQDLRLVLNNIIVNTTMVTLSDPSFVRRRDLICKSSPVVLSGYLETFLRDCSKRVMIGISGKNRIFTALPPAIQRCHFKNGGRVLNKLQEGRISWVTTTPTDIANRIAEGVNLVPSKPLWEAFGDTDSNPSAAVVKRYLEDMGIEKPHLKIDAKAAAAGGMSKNWATFSAELKLFMKVRNECAHSGNLTSAITPNDVINYCDLVDELAQRIVEVLTDHLAGF